MIQPASTMQALIDNPHLIAQFAHNTIAMRNSHSDPSIKFYLAMQESLEQSGFELH